MPELMPDTNRVPTRQDRELAGALSSLWPMRDRHPEDCIHLAIYVNDNYTHVNDLRRHNTFRKELENLVNRHSLENDVNMPDYLIAKYLIRAFDLLTLTVMDQQEDRPDA